MKTKLFITGLAFFAITSLGFSQNVETQDKPGRNQGKCSSFIDVNNDGVCDNSENRTPGQGKNASINKSGRNQGKHIKGGMNRPGKGRNFVDGNNNGTCDRREGSMRETLKK